MQQLRQNSYRKAASKDHYADALKKSGQDHIIISFLLSSVLCGSQIPICYACEKEKKQPFTANSSRKKGKTVNVSKPARARTRQRR
jgi:hypothetical protein